MLARPSPEASTDLDRVVMHANQSHGSRQIRIEADGGDPDCEQIVLDLHRMAALSIVERMRSEIVATVRACG